MYKTILFACLLAMGSSVSAAAVEPGEAPFNKRDVALFALTMAAVQATWHFSSLPRELTERELFAAVKVQILVAASLTHILLGLVERNVLAFWLKQIFYYLAAYCGGMAFLEGWLSKLGNPGDDFSSGIPYKAGMLLVAVAVIVFTHIHYISGFCRRKKVIHNERYRRS